MRLRDRRGPLSSIVLLAGYVVLIISTLIGLAGMFGFERSWQPGIVIWTLIWANMILFGWRIAMRFAFTWREYSIWEAMRAVVRIPLANAIAILAGRRAMSDYVKALRGRETVWDKTSHDAHPALAVEAERTS